MGVPEFQGYPSGYVCHEDHSRDRQNQPPPQRVRVQAHNFVCDCGHYLPPPMAPVNAACMYCAGAPPMLQHLVRTSPNDRIVSAPAVQEEKIDYNNPVPSTSSAGCPGPSSISEDVPPATEKKKNESGISWGIIMQRMVMLQDHKFEELKEYRHDMPVPKPPTGPPNIGEAYIWPAGDGFMIVHPLMIPGSAGNHSKDGSSANTSSGH